MRKSFPQAEVGRAAGVEPKRWEQLDSAGYARVNAHWRAELADGRRVFVKHALSDEAAAWLRQERRIFEFVRGSFMPDYIGSYDADGCTLLVIEDLSGATWPPPWSDERIAAVLSVLDALHSTRPPADLPTLESLRERIVGWSAIAADPEPLIATGLCSRAWLEEALPVLQSAGHAAKLAGDDLLHFDVRSDNLCFVDDRVVFVDWNLACVGNGRFDVAFWLPSLQLEGGRRRGPDSGELAAAVAGFFASRAGLPPPAGAPTVREFQRAQVEVALPWAARELGLPPPRLSA